MTWSTQHAFSRVLSAAQPTPPKRSARRCLSLRAGACVLLSVACLCTGASAHARAWSGIPSVDSASVARAAWARAGLALRSGDRLAARREVARAASAWPIQPSYLWAFTVLAAQAIYTLAALDGLRRYTALGLGRDLGADSALAAIAGAAMFAEIRSLNAANARPLARSRVERTFGDSTFWAEDADPITGHLYVASIRHRTIANVAPNGAARELWPPGQHCSARCSTFASIPRVTSPGQRHPAFHKPRLHRSRFFHRRVVGDSAG